jgi:hypothetical protein
LSSSAPTWGSGRREGCILLFRIILQDLFPLPIDILSVPTDGMSYERRKSSELEAVGEDVCYWHEDFGVVFVGGFVETEVLCEDARDVVFFCGIVEDAGGEDREVGGVECICIVCNFRVRGRWMRTLSLDGDIHIMGAMIHITSTRPPTTLAAAQKGVISGEPM